MTVVAARPIAELLTGFGPEAAVDAAAAALPWMVVAGLGQFTAGLLASTLAALDDYVVPALAFISGSLAGLVLLLVRIDENGTEAVAWGMALNAVLATTLMAVWLWTRARRERVPAGAARVDLRGSGRRLRELGSGASLPFALQAIYLVCLPIAAREGVGSVTSFGYAYLIAAAVVGISASSLGLVTAVPLTRMGLEPRRVARHVEASAWPALLLVAATAGIFAVAGAEIAGRVLGAAYGDDVGTQIGRLVVAMAPYMVASVALSVTFPLVFVAGRGSRLPVIGLVVLAIHVPVALAGQAVAGLDGLALALAVSTALAFAWMLTLLHAARSTTERLAVAVAVVAGCALCGFVPAGVLLGPGAGGGGRPRHSRPVRSRSFARSGCAPRGTTCESSREPAGDGRRAVVERARGHALVPSLARRGDLPAPRGRRRRQRLERRKRRCRGQGASRRRARPAGHESRVCRGHEHRDRRGPLAAARST